MSEATDPKADVEIATEDSGAVVAQIRQSVGRGDYLRAYDEARWQLSLHPDDLGLHYLMVLALARSGATRRATEELEAVLHERDLSGVPDDLLEDLGALRARLAKDRALDETGPRRAELAAVAASLYEANYERLGRSYSCVNAATMWLVAGEHSRSAALAHRTIELCELAPRDSAIRRYWLAATLAEARLLLSDLDGSAAALRDAASVGVDVATRATTRRQLVLICDLLDVDRATLDPLTLPTVVHYCGHMIDRSDDGKFPATAEEDVSAAIEARLDSHRVGFGHGSLASGADILFAEALLRGGHELHVVLPFDPDDFERVSVAPAGAQWVARYRRCLDLAHSILQATPGSYLDDDALFSHCSAIAMGQAIIQSRSLAAPVEQLAVWNGTTTADPAGTSADVATWCRLGLPSTAISPGPLGAKAPAIRAAPATLGTRRVRAMLFGDFQGFSRLDDPQILRFVEHVVGPLSAVLDRFSGEVLHQNTWGDGLYIVLKSVRSAAACTLALQDAMCAVDLERHGLPASLGLRIGAHAGPVTMAHDPIIDRAGFYGVEVTRTARIEPTTPPGDVYVTDVFAALLALEVDIALRCEYVGRIQTAKNFGEFPMFVLKKRGSLS